MFSKFSGWDSIFASQIGRLFLWIPVCFGAGIILFFTRAYEPNLTLSFLITLILGCLTALCIYKRESYPRLYGLSFFMIAVSVISCGFTTASIRTHLVYTPMLDKAIGPVDVKGTIEKLEIQDGGKSARIVLKDLAVERLSAERTPRKIRLVVRKKGEIKVGDRVSLFARLNPPSPPVAPGAFDFQRYAYFKGIGAVGFSYYTPEIITTQSSLHFFRTLQESMIKRIEEAIEYPQAGFAITLMTGQQGGISEDDRNAMRDAGLAHLLAISGMHVGMVAGIVFFASRLMMAAFPAFAMRYPIKKYAAVLALFAAIFYTFLSGGSVTTQRALLMTGIALLAIMLDRSPFSLRVVAIAAMAIMLIAPESVMNVSFQMSFAAVIGLISFYDAFRDKWSAFHSHAGFIRKAALYVLGIVITTIIAEIAIAPIAIYHFQHHSVYGLIGNVVAVPVTAFFVMPLLVFSALLMPISLEGMPLKLAAFGIDGITGIARWTSQLEGAVFNPPSFDGVALLWIILSGLLLCFLAGRVRLVATPVLVVGLLFALNTPRPDIYVSSKADVFALRQDNGALIVSSTRKDKYSRENWMRMNGQNGVRPEVFPQEGAISTGDQILYCDNEGCRIQFGSQNISLSKTEKAVLQDCEWADILIASIPVSSKCDTKYIIDRFDVWRNGAYHIYIRDQVRPVIKNVRYTRGGRIWDSRIQREREKRREKVFANNPAGS